MLPLSFRSVLAGLAAAVCTVAYAADPGKAATVQILDWQAPVPKAWVRQQPANTMRLVQLQAPGKSAGDNAEVIVFYFGIGGGSVQANVDRWVSQFSTPDGKPVKPVVNKFKVSGMQVTSVELNGTYARGVGMGPQGAGLPNHTLLAQVVETAKGNLTFHLWGPKATVASHRAGFEAMVKGLKPGGT
ncbi:MAG: hypothetical protein HYU77_14650 [Betaproteobacteria bacterium]|nr:hypothetical protein [Betaproteobacteria bacterium]